MRRKWPVLGASPSIVDGRPDEERPDGLFADLMKVGDAVTELRNGKWKRTSPMQGTRELVARSVTSVTRPQLVGWQSSVSQHRRGIARPVVRHGIPRWVHLLASACVAALMIGTALGAPLSADADTYPSWDDVQAAKANTANTAESITKLSG